MQGKFIYVFDTNARDRLLESNFQLLKADNDKNVFVFENKNAMTFSEIGMEDFEFVFSNTLTF